MIPPPDAPSSVPPGPPTATYRMQFGPSFGFDDARKLVPYLSALGVSHLYASPILAARPGSTHGYDIVDHGRLNPELGDASAFDALVDALHRHGMGLILDFVPNHMGVGTDNPWWSDVLEWGTSSPFSRFFDIDWKPLEASLQGKLLLPVLGDHYGAVLERGELLPDFDPQRGAFSVRHGESRFPLSPRVYPDLLRNAARGAPEAASILEPLAEEMAAALKERGSRRRDAAARERVEALKRRLAEAVADEAGAADAIAGMVKALRGREGEPESFDPLHRILERQHYRLAFWRVAAHEINYRRFFDIPDLAGLRMEEPELFQASHALVGRLVAEGKVQGLRLDHVDGLRDPEAYLGELRDRVSPGYLVVEKILAPDEELPPTWPVEGTTGYDFLAEVNGLLVDPAGEAALTRFHGRFTGETRSFREVEESCRRRVMEESLTSELNVLAHQFNRLAKQSRATRDFTFTGLRRALADVVAHFPVYRTYLTPGARSDGDLGRVAHAVDHARRGSRLPDTSVYDFIRDILTLGPERGLRWSHRRADVVDTALRFQQYTGPVTAKAVEDTAFYRYLRLVSLNEVGGDPQFFAISPEAFHEANQRRGERHPLSMVTTATHDHKRGEDVRARLAVLSESPREWTGRVRRWRRMNRGATTELPSGRAPTPADEYLFYQTLVGCWPPELDSSQAEALAALVRRLKAYAEKAAREAGTRTSWLARNEEYEDALAAFIDGVLDPERNRSFVDEMVAFVQEIAPAGVVNSLAQVVLKETVPGVSDHFQGTEFWDLSLVDPDNRRPVDYVPRVESLARPPVGREGWAKLLAEWPSGQVKQHLIARLLDLRRRDPALFLEGRYHALDCSGSQAPRVMAFARVQGERALMVVVPRLVAGLIPPGGHPLPREWGDTVVEVPEELLSPDGAAPHPSPWRDVFTGSTTQGARLKVAELMDPLPVAVLLGPRPLLNAPGSKGPRGLPASNPGARAWP